MKKIRNVLLIFTLLVTSGCMGQMGLSQMAMGVNLKMVDNRWGRATIYFFAAPVYGFTGFLDLLVFNSIEFWTGTNPLTKKSPAVVDTDVETWMKVDDDLDDSLTKPALGDDEEEEK